MDELVEFASYITMHEQGLQRRRLLCNENMELGKVFERETESSCLAEDV